MSESASNGDRDPATEKIPNDNKTCAVQLGPIRPSIIEFPQSNQGSKKHFQRIGTTSSNGLNIRYLKMLLFVFLPMLWHAW